MKLVIDIHEKDYQSILNSGQVPYGVVCAIMNGTPLPKGHGRLGDLDELKRTMEEDVRRALSFVDLTDFVLLSPTIIEADKEANDG